ncbi:MAG: sensor histidine kinase [bacterium]
MFDNGKEAKKQGILIVDDSRENLRLLHTILAREGYTVRLSTNGSMALDSVRSAKPDLIILDIKMPGLDGYEVCRRLKADRDTEDIPVLFISGVTEFEEKMKSFAVGGIDYITKPFKAEEVLARIKVHLTIERLQNQLKQANERLEQKVTERTAELESVNEALMRSEKRYRAIVHDQSELIYRSLPDGRITFVNDSFCRYYNCHHDQLIGQRFIPPIPEDDRAVVEESIASLKIDHPLVSYAHRVVMPDGEMRWQQWSKRAIFDDTGQVVEFQGVGRDITEQKRAEERIIKTLHEKEMLLKEIHHRVKNNLLVLYGLIGFQQAALGDVGKTGEILESTKQRIQAMGRVHQMLYQAKNLSEIDFSQYVRSMVEELRKTYHVGKKRIEVAFELDPVLLSIETAVPCGLIVNELLVNAFAHAFPEKKVGHISVSLKEREGKKELCVRDDGVGLSEERIFDESKTLGLHLVFMLTKQLKGEITYKKENGSVFTLIF